MYDDDDDWKGDWTHNVKSGRTWKRGFLVLFFAAILWIAKVLLYFAALTQFVAVLITGRPIDRLLPFCRSLSTYIRDLGLYVTWNSDTKPFPFSSWPPPGESADYSGDDEYRDPIPERDEPFEPDPDIEPEDPSHEALAGPANGEITPPVDEDEDPESPDDTTGSGTTAPPRPDA